MDKQYLNLCAIICLLMGVYCMYYMLLINNTLPCSISSVEASLCHWIKHWRVLVVGLMPVYVAFTLFGAAICSLLAGSFLHRWLTDLLHGK